jgi:aminobenzoyl-glutamate utilization protein B
MDYEVIGGVYNMLPNVTLSKVMDKNLRIVNGFTYTTEEKAFAEKIQATLTGSSKTVPLEASTTTIQPFTVSTEAKGAASSDVGDVSWTVPTAGISTATFIPGSSGHSWQNVAAAGSSIGEKGMIMAAKAIALSAYDLFKNPVLVEESNKELARTRGADFKYEAMLGDRKPALDYRK